MNLQITASVTFTLKISSRIFLDLRRTILCSNYFELDARNVRCWSPYMTDLREMQLILNSSFYRLTSLILMNIRRNSRSGWWRLGYDRQKFPQPDLIILFGQMYPPVIGDRQKSWMPPFSMILLSHYDLNIVEEKALFLLRRLFLISQRCGLRTWEFLGKGHWKMWRSPQSCVFYSHGPPFSMNCFYHVRRCWRINHFCHSWRFLIFVIFFSFEVKFEWGGRKNWIGPIFRVI